MNFAGRLLLAQAQGKALGPNRFTSSNAPLRTYVAGGGGRERGLLTQREAKHHLQAYGGSEAIDWVMNATSLYSDAAGSAPWHLEKDGKRLVEKRTELNTQFEVADAGLLRLLRQPNPYMDYMEQMELLVIDLLLVGNAYWLKYRQTADGKPLALYRMSPAHVKVRPGPQGIDKYLYQPEGVTEPLEYDPQEVMHFKRPNPHDPYYGLGIIKGGGRPFDLELAMTDAQTSYFENKAEPSLIVQSERRVPRDVFDKLTRSLRGRVQGTGKAGELLVLESGLQAKTLTPSARDAMYAELSDKSRDRILGMFRAHPSLLGIPGSNTGQDKVADVRREFDNKTIRPFLNRLQGRLTEGLVAAWGYDFKIDYNYTLPQEDAIKLSGDYGSIPGIKVIEMRRYMVDAGLLRDESTGDPTIDEIVLNLPGENAGEDGQSVEGDTALADRGLPGEAGRPPKGENTASFPRNGGALPAGARARRPEGKAILSIAEIEDQLRLYGTKALPSLDASNVRTSVGNKLPNEKRPDDSQAQQRLTDQNALIADMTRDLTQALNPLERKLLDHVEGKAFSASDASKKIRNSQAWGTFREMVETTMQKYAERAVALGAVQNDNTEDMDYEAIAKEIVYRPDGVRKIVDNFKKNLTAKVQNAPDEGTAQKAIRDGVKIYGDSQVTSIAESEVVEAYNEGALTTFELRGDTDVFVSDGEDDDQPCKDADGSIWTIDHARKHRKEHPRCRRAFVSLAGTI